MDLGGQTMLERVVGRSRQSQVLDAVGVATSTDPGDDVIARHCGERGILCHRGSLNDVLDRYRTAAEAWQADLIVRLTCDCPLLDAEVLDRVVKAYRTSAPPVDYVSNTLARTFPRGLDVEVFSRGALDRAGQEDNCPAWREHVTPFLYRRPDLFRTSQVAHAFDESRHRWTVDTPEDLELIRRIYAAFDDDRFGWRDVIALLERHQDWLQLNAHVEQKSV
jgi:spore coat polysaccharide biosynthesis protein SpsF